MKRTLFFLPLFVIGFAAQAIENQHSHTSKYTGQERRAIKSLSREDVAELRRGGGWGLAKAAELNGVPGPAHLLGLKDKISLTADQVVQIKGVYENMRSQAVEQGEIFITLEMILEGHFKRRTITDAILRSSLKKIAEARKNLRYVHLATHLKMPEILSEAQYKKYNVLRGYASSDPCANVPEGDNAEIWRKHNECN